MNDATVTVTLDDSVFCNLCDPPYETSFAMFRIHMEREHGWGDQEFDALRDAPIIVQDDSDPRGGSGD